MVDMITRELAPCTVSVVIPTFNSAGPLDEAIKSVLSQSYQNLEVIVVDDGSSDNTDSLVRSFGGRVTYLKQSNMGVSAARNKGIRRSQGKYVAFLDADDVWLPQKLEEQIPCLDQDPKLGLVCSDFSVVSENGRSEPSYLSKCKYAKSGRVFDEVVREYFILTSTAVIRRSCLDEVGLFDESLRQSEDRDLWLRVSYNWNILILRKCLAIKRNQAGNLSSRLQSATESRIAVFQKTLRSIPGMPPRSRRIVQQELAGNYFDRGHQLFSQERMVEAREDFRRCGQYHPAHLRATSYLIASYLPLPVVRAIRSAKWRANDARTKPEPLAAPAVPLPKMNLVHSPKKVLVVAYDFPPRRTSGVYRTTNLTKYLFHLGWQATVLTAERRRGDIEDATLLEDFPSKLGIERTKDLNIDGWEDRAAAGIRATGGLKSHAKDVRQPKRDRFVRSLGDFVRSCLYFPDSRVGWIPTSLAKAVALQMERRFDLVYTTSPPQSTPLIGLFLKLLLGVPWVAEFRDPWELSSRPWRKRPDRRLFQFMLKHADRVVVISKGLARELELSYGLSGQKVAVISNGFDEKDFESFNGMKSEMLTPGYQHFSHFGTVYPNYSGNFFPALVDLVKECPELRDRIRVNVIGFPDETVRRYAEGAELRGILQLHAFVKHHEAIAAMRSSDCLLLFLADQEIARLSGLGKIYDYLRVGQPVLAVAHEGGTTELVREGQAGWVVAPEDTDTIKQTLSKIIEDVRVTRPPAPFRPEFVEQFRWDRLAFRLAGVFDSVSSHGA